MGGAQLAEVTIRPAGAEAIPALRPLWCSLHDHHVEIAPHLQQLGPVRRAEDSWAIRAALYEEWLAEPDAFVMLAERDGSAVGYAMVHLRGPEESWQTGPRIATLETLAVRPGWRGLGVGSRLIEGVYERLRGVVVAQLEVSVISSNVDARRFYERLGLLPFCVSYIGRIPSGSPGSPGLPGSPGAPGSPGVGRDGAHG